ncbi:hypothetical protein M3Y94_00388000 [Aphelenchoides besseyi]|nr:hypothetical protein M3Y94_00388000 [Aphelenchoides besseyi]KAI6235024.1 DNA-directed RNA polymerase III subunit Rpc5 family-containing protein [Aphelenchoides besseyi]
MHVLKLPKAEPVDSPPQEENPTPMEVDEDRPIAEYNVVVLRPSDGKDIERYVFEQSQPANMNGCKGRLKRNVKHVEFTYETQRKMDGTPVDETTALFDGLYNGECYTKTGDAMRDCVGFFKNGTLYLLPINDAYGLRRQLVRSTENNRAEQSKIDDENLERNAPKTSQVVRTSFARTETDWQKRRREQSAHYRAMLIEQDSWIDCNVQKRNVESLLANEIIRASGTANSSSKKKMKEV